MASPTFVAATTSGNTAGNSTSCLVPSGTTEFDVMYWWCSQNDVGEDSEPTSTGWVTVVNQDISNPPRLWCLRKVAGDSEPSFYTVTWTDSQSLQVGGMITVRGADNTTPEAATPSGATGDDDSPDPPASGTVTSGDYLALAFMGMQGKRGPNTGPTNYTERIDHYTTGGGPAGNHCGLGVSTRELTGITSENPGVFTTNQGDTWVAGMLLIAEEDLDQTIAVNEVAETETAVAIAVGDTPIDVAVGAAAEVEAAVAVAVDAASPQTIGVTAAAEVEAAVAIEALSAAGATNLVVGVF